MLEKTFEAASVEPRIAEIWEKAEAFKAGAGAKPGAEPFSIVIPPPNVTGNLHMGHALNNTLQDILARWKRMQGFDVLWQPGTDHAGIATQMVVERKLAETQQPGRRALGREVFLEKVWAWKEESGGAIVNQLKRLGASCDWSRERFTMGRREDADDQMRAAVLKVFVGLYKKGLIYRGKRLVNWDPKFETAISDLEVENREVDGHMWHFKYPLAGGATYTYVEKDADGNVTFSEERNYISIATTRPETMLGDGAVAVHPSDERYRPIVGTLCEIPVGPKEHRRLIPIITDEYPDPDFGSGAVKITGAHDFNDYQVATRNGIPLYRLMDDKAQMRADGLPYADCANAAMAIIKSGVLPGEREVDAINLVPDEYRGLDRYEARKRIIDAINAEGLAVTVKDAEGNDVPYVEKKKIMQPFGDRSGVVIEPHLTDQWYVNAEYLAKAALAAVKDGRTRFVPKNWENTYFQWMENIQPWCVSRQLWWGHQIPAWYAEDGTVFVEESEAAALAAAAAHFGKPVTLSRDEDVLDTWFSSALWPFSTMGWPEQTTELRRYYPTSVLITGFDIIFFWVARMMMMGLEFMDGEIPFHDVYIHALVRDEKGAKMSKSKGNVIDPLVLIDDFGADALRFTLAAMAAQGRDIKLSLKRVEGYKAFSNKIWNAARFAEMNECRLVPGFDPATVTLTVNRWILGSAAKAIAEVHQALTDYKFNDAAGAAYRFTWNTFCDWYLELAKPIFQGSDEAQKAETRATCAHVFDQILKVLHPFMPFITEELWEKTAETAGVHRPNLLILSEWPTLTYDAGNAYAEIEWLVGLVSDIRSVRMEMNVAPGAQVPLVFVGANAETRSRVAAQEAAIMRLARISAISFAAAAPSSSAQIVAGEATACLPLEGLIDFAVERARLQKEKKKLDDEVSRIDAKLGNAAFVAKAPEEVIEEQKEKREDYVERRVKVMEALARLG